MPIALGAEFIVLAAAVLLSAWLYANRILLITLIRATLARVPLVGGKLASVAESVVNAALQPAISWLEAHTKTLAHWLVATADMLADLPHEITHLAGTVENAVRHLVTVKVPGMITDRLHPIEKTVAQLHDYAHAVGKALGHDVDALKRGIDDMGHTVLTDAERFATHGIDRLRSDLLDRVIPGVRGEIRTAERTLAGEIRVAEHDVAQVAHELQALAKRLGIPLAVVEAMIAAVGAAAAVRAIERVIECEGKLAKMCTSDPGQWARLIEGLALLAAWPGLRELVNDMAPLVRDSSRTIASLIRDGS